MKKLEDLAPDKGMLEKEIKQLELFQVDVNELYWFSKESGGGVFLLPNGRGGYQSLGGNDLSRHLKICGFDDIREDKYSGEDSKISAIDYLKVWVQQKKNVDFIGSLAGYKVGLKKFGSKLALVTSEAEHTPPKEGDYSFIDNHFRQLFGGDEQIQYFYGWLQRALEDLRDEKAVGGLAISLSGPVDCGKTLFREMLSQILGGRSEEAGDYLKGDTKFNAELCGAELWVLDDEISPKKFNDREELAQFIKKTAAKRTQSIHGKFKEQFSIPLFRRLLLCTNDEIESLKVLPPIGMDGVSDKLLVFKAHAFDLPPLSTKEDQDKFWQNFKKALPGFLDYVLNKWVTPEEIRNVRWGVNAYHSPEIYDKLLEAQPETSFHETVQQWLEKTGRTRFKGAPSELLEELEDYSNSFRQLRLRPDAIGRYVQRLHKRGGDYESAYIKGREHSGRYVMVSFMVANESP